MPPLKVDRLLITLSDVTKRSSLLLLTSPPISFHFISLRPPQRHARPPLASPPSLPSHLAEEPPGHLQLRQGVYQDAGGLDSDGQTCHNEPGPGRVPRLLLHQPRIRGSSKLAKTNRLWLFEEKKNKRK